VNSHSEQSHIRLHSIFAMPKKSRSKNKSHSGVDKKGKILKTKRKTKDLDEVQKTMVADTARQLLNQPIDYDVPGAGQHYCLYCA
jgi:bud site selection protein 20